MKLVETQQISTLSSGDGGFEAHSEEQKFVAHRTAHDVSHFVSLGASPRNFEIFSSLKAYIYRSEARNFSTARIFPQT